MHSKLPSSTLASTFCENVSIYLCSPFEASYIFPPKLHHSNPELTSETPKTTKQRNILSDNDKCNAPKSLNHFQLDQNTLKYLRCCCRNLSRSELFGTLPSSESIAAFVVESTFLTTTGAISPTAPEL